MGKINSSQTSLNTSSLLTSPTQVLKSITGEEDLITLDDETILVDLLVSSTGAELRLPFFKRVEFPIVSSEFFNPKPLTLDLPVINADLIFIFEKQSETFITTLTSLLR